MQQRPTEDKQNNEEPARPEAEVERPDVIEEGPSLPAILEESYVEKFEKGVETYKRFVSACYRLTNESHWINHGSDADPKLSLQGPGAEALMNPLGISLDKPEVRREQRVGFYVYWTEGFAESKALGRRGYYIGYCDSRDKFFNAMPGWSPETGEGDIRKSSYTNWTVNAVTRLAGLRSPDPKLLINAGLETQRILRIDYSGKNKSTSKEPISDAQIKRLLAIAGKAGLQEKPLVQKIVENYDYIDPLQKDGGTWEILKQIRRSDYDEIVSRAEKAGKSKDPGEEG